MIYLFDVNETTSTMLNRELEELKETSSSKDFKVILAGNKTDLSAEELKNKFNGTDVVFVSAKQKTNISALKEKLLSKTGSGETLQNNFIVTNVRHVAAFKNTNHALEKTLEGLEKKLSGDLLSPHLRNALQHLGEVTGEVTTEDLLQNIF